MHSQRYIMQILDYSFHTSSLVFAQVLTYPILISKYGITSLKKNYGITNILDGNSQ